MRVVVPQITWHSRDPVLSVDFDPSCKPETDGFYRAASGGGDCSLLVSLIVCIIGIIGF